MFVQLVTSSPIQELVSCGHQSIKCNMSASIGKKKSHRGCFLEFGQTLLFYHHRRMLKCFYIFYFL
jgi:hypothetical protein